MTKQSWNLYTVTTLDRLHNGDFERLANSLKDSDANLVVGCRGFPKALLPVVAGLNIIPVQLPFVISLSSARNILLRKFPASHSTCIAFPDDDAYFVNEKVLRKAEQILTEYDFLIGSVSPSAEEISTDQGKISDGNLDFVLKFVCSAGIYVRSEVVSGFNFDISLGLGTPNRSGEDIDLFLWLYSQGNKGFFDQHVCLIHPKKLRDFEYFSGGLLALAKYRGKIKGIRFYVTRRIFHGFLIFFRRGFCKKLFLQSIIDIVVAKN